MSRVLPRGALSTHGRSPGPPPFGVRDRRASPGPPSVHARTPTRGSGAVAHHYCRWCMQDPSPQGPLNTTAPYIEDHASATTTPPAGTLQDDRRDLRRTKDNIQDDCDARRLPTVYFLQCPTTEPPAIQGKTTTSILSLMYAAPPYDYKRRRWASFSRAGRWLVGLSLFGFSLPRGRSGTTEYSSQPTPLLAETWELPSLSRLACTPYYKYSGCKIIQCPRTPPLLDVRPHGRNQDKPCVTVLPLASSCGTRKHAAFTSWDPGPQVGTPTVGAPVRGAA